MMFKDTQICAKFFSLLGDSFQSTSVYKERSSMLPVFFSPPGSANKAKPAVALKLFETDDITFRSSHYNFSGVRTRDTSPKTKMELEEFLRGKGTSFTCASIPMNPFDAFQVLRHAG